MLPGMVTAAAPGDRRRAKVLHRHFHMVSSSLHRHHEYEDEHFWPAVAERDPLDADLAHRMESQHARIAETLLRLPELWDAWIAEPDSDTAAPLAFQLAELANSLVEHLDDEERYLLPILERTLSVAEWDAFGKHAADTTPKRELLLIGGMAMEEMTPQEVEDMAQHLAVAVWLIRHLDRPIYRRYARKVRVAHGSRVGGGHAGR